METIPLRRSVETYSTFEMLITLRLRLKSSRQHAYVTLKVYEYNSSHGRREKEVYKHLRNLKSSHIGFVLVRSASRERYYFAPSGQLAERIHYQDIR